MRDRAFTTPRALVRARSFLAEHRSVVDTVRLNGGLVEPLLVGLSNQLQRPVRREDWMLRIVDVPRALALRGYPDGLEATIPLLVRDDVLEPREARYTLRVRDGAATVEPGGSGAVAVDVRGLAALYSGHMAPAELAALGYLDGDARKASALAAVFAGPTSWMNEIVLTAVSSRHRDAPCLPPPRAAPLAPRARRRRDALPGRAVPRGLFRKKQRPEPAGTAGPTGPASVDPVTARARERVAPYKAALKQALEKGMAESPEAAIEVCAARAPEFARAASSDGMTIGRTALRLRNPDNAPRPWVVPLMEELSTAPKGTMASRTLSLPGGKIGYVEAIRLAPAPCPVCHGDPAKPIRDKLQRGIRRIRRTGFVPAISRRRRGPSWTERASCRSR